MRVALKVTGNEHLFNSPLRPVVDTAKAPGMTTCSSNVRTLVTETGASAETAAATARAAPVAAAPSKSLDPSHERRLNILTKRTVAQCIVPPTGGQACSRLFGACVRNVSRMFQDGHRMCR